MNLEVIMKGKLSSIIIVMVILILATFNIQAAENNELRVRNILISNLRELPRELVMSKLKIREGETYSTKKISDTYLALRELPYINDANFYTQVEGDNIDIRIEVDEMPNALEIAKREESREELSKKTEFIISNVSITGLQSLKEADFIKDIPLKTGEFFVPQDAIDGASKLFNSGYFSSVEPKVVRGADNTISIEYVVEENPRVNNITIEGNTIFTEAELLSALEVKKGDILNIEKMDPSKNGVIKKYQDSGYTLARIDDMKLDDSGNVRIILSEGTIEAIEYRKIGKKREGERRTPKSTDLRTQDYILERETRMKVGEIFQRDKMEQTIRNIYRTGLFTSIQPNFKPSATDPNGRIIEMEAEERPAASINGNISYGTSVGFLGGINYTDSNFLGRAQEFKAAIEISDEGDQTYEISIFDPWIRGTERLQAGASIYYRQTEDDDANGTDLYKVKRYGTRWTLGQGLNDDIYVRGAIRYEDVKEYYRDGTKRDDYDLVAFTPTITYDTRNNRFSPQKGIYLNLSDEIGKIVSDHRSYNQFEIDLRAYHRTFFKDKNTMAYRAVWGTTGSETPEALRFKMGGADSIRGYDYGDFEGYNEFYFNVENRTQVTNSIQVVAFFDIGNAWQTNDKKPDRDGADKFKDLKSGAGIGVRILTPVGPLKFDYAWPLDIAPGDSKKDNGKFYFNFGPSW